MEDRRDRRELSYIDRLVRRELAFVELKMAEEDLKVDICQTDAAGGELFETECTQGE